MLFLQGCVPPAKTILISPEGQEGCVNVNQQDHLYYQIFGSGDPIVVVNGGPGLDQTYLLPQMQELAKNHTVIFYDQRGTGRSLDAKVDAETMTLHQFVEDLENLRKTLGYSKITLLGHSFGAFIAMHYAIKYQDHLKSLVFVHPHPATSVGYQAFEDYSAKALAPLEPQLNQITNRQSFNDYDPETIIQYYRLLFKIYFADPFKVDQLTLTFTKATAEASFKVLDFFIKNDLAKPYDLRPQLSQIKVPTLIVHGDKDPIPLWTAEQLKEVIPYARMVVLKNCGHFPYIESPAEFFKEVSDFLAPSQKAET